MGVRVDDGDGGALVRPALDRGSAQVVAMIISQEDARRAIELLTKAHDAMAALLDGDPLALEEEVADFLFDDFGDSRFEERAERDPSPDCRCEECPPGGPFTCISED
jgi:hypothetical protein